ncbi:MAG: sigma-54-dependent Fis family transcriptional regulator [candidate division Zixibacteria bacterium]|nr:sigma-54-dependent Fis family transcriptional regulator [candidate division Zixibacteria bacterium]
MKGVNQEEDNPESNMECHKSALKILGDSSLNFLGAVVCSRLAELYEKSNNPKISNSYYKHASKIAERIGNKVVSERLIKKSKESALKSDFHSSISGTLKTLSEVFKSVESFQVTLDKLLGIAIELTGAERGALILKTPETGELRIVSQKGLQKRDLDDAMNLSMSIPKSVTGNPAPMVLEDARSDYRTKSFRSVARYNILSVVCVPIILRDETEGALYLDHHTLPAFFRESDHETVSSIATFISHALSTVLEYRSVKSSYTQALEDKKTAGIYSKFISHDSRIAKLFERMELVARSNTNVLILGESGTGKELLADATHEASLRSDKHLVKLNCAAIPSTLIESQLFGVARNTVTGVSEVEGIFSAADGGTLFMDEVADLPLEIQAKVLRAIEYQHFHKIGNSRLTSVDIRFIFATSKNLPKMISEGSFREDLYHRICTIELKLSPLRERLNDLDVLIGHFLRLFTPPNEKSPVFSEECLQIFRNYGWPGNVRELKNVVEGACILCRGGVVSPIDLPRQFENVEPGSKSPLFTFERPERETISKLLLLYQGNQSAVARVLKMSKTTLHRKIKKYDLG